MADTTTLTHPGAKNAGRAASVAYLAIDIADRLWRKLNRMLDKAVVAWDARRR